MSELKFIPIFSLQPQQVFEEKTKDESSMNLDESSLQRKKPKYQNIEKVGQYLKAEKLSQPISSKNPWRKFLQENPEIKNLDFIIDVNSETSLIQEFTSAKESAEAIFSSITSDLTSMSRNLGQLRIPADLFDEEPG